MKRFAGRFAGPKGWILAALTAAAAALGLLARTSTEAQGPPPLVCVDTFNCGGCCGHQQTIRNFLRCCDRGGGFACATRFGCK